VKIWQGAEACAQRLDADLIVFPGRNLEAPHGFDYQYNRIFQLMSKENLDALVLVATLISNYIEEDALLEFCSRFSEMPLVSVGIRIPGVPSIVIDNRAGVREVVGHMVEHHGAGRIAFIRGPSNNWEANERFDAYRDELAFRGIAFDERLVAQGDFTHYSVGPAIEDLLRDNPKVPDAFIFANDEMAIQGMRILNDKGIKVPGSTAVAGFDDILEASTQATPMTTVRQPLFDMAWRACQMASELVDGGKVPELTELPAESVVRSSCGCLAHSVSDIRTLDRLVQEKPVGAGDRAACYSMAMSALTEGKYENIHAVEERKDAIREALDGLLDSRDDGSGLIARFGEVLKDEVQAGLRPGEWQFIFAALSDSIERAFRGAFDSHRLSFLSRACVALSVEMDSILINGINSEMNGMNLVMHEVQYFLSSIVKMEDLVEALKSQLPRLGISTFFLLKFEQEWVHAPRTRWEIPDKVRFVAGTLAGHDIFALGDSMALYPSRRLSPHAPIADGKRRTFAVYPLFFRETHYGTIVYELTHHYGFVYESLTTQISGIIKAITLYQAKDRAEESLRRAMMELENFNEQLSSLSLTDELTGLFNRRGFLKLASQQLNVIKQMGKNALLIYGDVDGLKAINDKYGHGEGDCVIKSAADVLRKVFRSMDIIARLGGDEFTVFASNTNEKQITYFQSRLSEILEEANSDSGKPYKISMSLGCAECLSSSDSTLDDYLRMADAMLYDQKAKRKELRGTDGNTDPGVQREAESGDH